MNALIVSNEHLPELEALNASGDPRQQLKPVTLADGRQALNADLLLDCEPDQTWDHYRSFLQTLQTENDVLLAITILG